jgi:hypothetical protein
MGQFNSIIAAINIILLISNMQTRDELNNSVITKPISQVKNCVIRQSMNHDLVIFHGLQDASGNILVNED